MANVTCWDLLKAAASTGGRRILIWGDRGLAKSRTALDMLRENHEVVSQCSLNDDIAVQELLGHYIPKTGNFEWHDGPVMRSYRAGGGLVVNEIGRASGAVQDMFLSVLDDKSVSMIALPNGEDVKPGDNFQVIATSNSDPESMDPALYDRFDSIVHINTPHPGLIAYINERRKGLGDIVLRSFAAGAKNISPRRALTFVSYIEKGLSEELALQLSFGPMSRDVSAAMKLTTAAKK